MINKAREYGADPQGAFQKPIQDSVALLNAIQGVYATKDVTVA